MIRRTRVLAWLMLLTAWICLSVSLPVVMGAPAAPPVTRPPVLPTQTPRPIFASLTPSVAPLPTLPAGTAATWTPLPTWTPPSMTAQPSGSHLWLAWPLVGGAETLSRVYPYGGTNRGQLQVHHGDDLIRPTGTPIFAAADGTVYFAGNDFVTVFGAYANYYGNLVVIQHSFLSPDGFPVYTLYGHMDSVLVQAGQSVRQGDPIGTVGASGIALGPHLHFEVRLGNPLDFGASRNPELWLRPAQDRGLLAGRVVDAAGGLVNAVAVEVQSTQLYLTTPTYGDSSVYPDNVFGENFSLGNLPSDYYTVSVRLDGVEQFAQPVFIYPGAMTWIDIQLPS